MLENNKSKWYIGHHATEGITGWVHLDFKRTLKLKGFAITSANDCPHRDPKSFRLFAKLKSTDEAEGQDFNEWKQKNL